MANDAQMPERIARIIRENLSGVTSTDPDIRAAQEDDLMRTAILIAADLCASGQQVRAISVERVEMVSYERGYEEPADPIWRVVVGEYCADFETETAARNFAGAIAAPTPAPQAEAGSRKEVQCDTCAGNGEIVTDWHGYLHPPQDAPADHAVAECPDCDGLGRRRPPDAATPTAKEAVQCCMCGKKGLSTVEGDGGGECQLWDDRWTCSRVCYDIAYSLAHSTQPSETVAEAAKVVIEHEPCPKCASVNVEPYWWHRGQAWIIICQDCKHEEGRENAEYEAWQVWDDAALRALKGEE